MTQYIVKVNMAKQEFSYGSDQPQPEWTEKLRLEGGDYQAKDVIYHRDHTDRRIYTDSKNYPYQCYEVLKRGHMTEHRSNHSPPHTKTKYIILYCGYHPGDGSVNVENP